MGLYEINKHTVDSYQSFISRMVHVARWCLWGGGILPCHLS